MLHTFKTLPELFAAFPAEQDAVDHFTAIRWARGKFCPLCGNAEAERIGTLSGTNVHKCYVCRKRFSIRVGTIFQNTKLPLRTWFATIWMITNHPRGIASTTLATDLGITQKTAWFVLHRLRHAARTDSFNAPLNGEVKVDETYVGGKAANRHKDKSGGPGTSGKTAVVGAVSREGGFAARLVDKNDTATLDSLVHDVVAPDAIVSADEHSGYRHLGRTYVHFIVRHSAGEYAQSRAHTNTIEGAWALLKRQVIGIHHWVSLNHLHRYVGEMSYRVNRRTWPRGRA